MNSRAKKNKGLRLENYLVEYFRETLDKGSYRVAASGSGLDKNDVRIPSWNMEVEAKNSETLTTKSALEQAERQNTTGNIPIVVMRHPDYAEFKKLVVAIDLDNFIELLLRNTEIEVKQELSGDLKWKVKQLKESAHKVFKELNKYE